MEMSWKRATKMIRSTEVLNGKSLRIRRFPVKIQPGNKGYAAKLRDQILSTQCITYVKLFPVVTDAPCTYLIF